MLLSPYPCGCRWLKGWFRSAKALQGLGRIELARQAAEKAQQLEPGNKEVGDIPQSAALVSHSYMAASALYAAIGSGFKPDVLGGSIRHNVPAALH